MPCDFLQRTRHCSHTRECIYGRNAFVWGMLMALSCFEARILQIGCCIRTDSFCTDSLLSQESWSDEGSSINGIVVAAFSNHRLVSAMSMSQPPEDEHQPHIVLVAGRCFVWDVVSYFVPAYEPSTVGRDGRNSFFHTLTFTGHRALAARSLSHPWYLRWSPKTWNKSSTHDADLAA
jgi:hypothetical protein